MKLAGEWLVKDHTRKYNMSHTIVRPSAVYGPLDVNDRVIAKFFAAAMNDRPIVVNGLQELLDFTYVEDAAEGIVLATLSDNAANKTYNITKGQSRTLLDAADCVRSLVGKGVIEVCNKDSSFPSRGALNIDTARNDLGFNPTTDIEEGLQKYYDWLINTPFWSSKTV
jgi:UDP-glucose 4-epimerase